MTFRRGLGLIMGVLAIAIGAPGAPAGADTDETFLGDLPVQVGMTWRTVEDALSATGRMPSGTPSGRRLGIAKPDLRIGRLRALNFIAVTSNFESVTGVNMAFGSTSSSMNCAGAISDLRNRLGPAWGLRNASPEGMGRGGAKARGEYDGLPLEAGCMTGNYAAGQGMKVILVVNLGAVGQ